jgi:hypothetical protein
MNSGEKIGLYGKGAVDVAKAREDAKKATQLAGRNFDKTKAYNCILQEPPKP